MSAPKRFFIENIDYPTSDRIIIDGEEFVHAKTVLRIETGAEIVLLDNSGKEYFAIVDKIEKRCLSAHIVGVKDGDKEPNVKICLICGALKGDKTELVVQKATELGAYEIAVFNSQFCSAFMSDNKIDRLNKVAKEAAKQCQRSKAPKVRYFDKFKDALAFASHYENKLFACEFATESQADLSNLKGSTAVVVGSEGGFSKEEFALAQEEYGFKGITLGKRILRAETACITTLSIIAFSLGELK